MPEQLILDESWEDFRGPSHDRGLSVHDEILREAPVDHDLRARRFEVIAKRRSLDHHIVHVEDGRYALVHLTYRMSDRPDPLFDAEFFDSTADLLEAAERWRSTA